MIIGLFVPLLGLAATLPIGWKIIDKIHQHRNSQYDWERAQALSFREGTIRRNYKSPYVSWNSAPGRIAS